MFNGIVIKGRIIIIPILLQRKLLQQLHSNHVGIKNTRCLERGLVYKVNRDADIKNTTKWSASCLKYQQTQPQGKTIPHQVPC